MRLLAALVPPEPVLDDLTAVVRSVRGGTNELRHVPAHLLHIPLANFGNVGLNETVALRDALAGELATRPPLGLRFQGGSALDFPGDDSIWAKLGGDVEQLAALGAVVPRVVQRLGFLVDRRLFRTSVRIGHITPSTSAGYLERVVGRLDG
ncbi:MAG: 2'-5' RNA ligase family protein, partial [Nocardioidaceae bacterium]